MTDGALGESLGTRLFKTRVGVIVALDKRLAEVGIGPFTPAGAAVIEVSPGYGDTEHSVRDLAACSQLSIIATMKRPVQHEIDAAGR